MAGVKKIGVNELEGLLSKVVAKIELIRSKQEEREAIIESFEKEHKRFLKGELSKRAYQAALTKQRKMLAELDKDIRRSIRSVNLNLGKIRKSVSSQTPSKVSFDLTGLVEPVKKRAKTVKKKAMKAVKKVGETVKK